MSICETTVSVLVVIELPIGKWVMKSFLVMLICANVEKENNSNMIVLIMIASFVC
jgi:hypothetical protein